MRRWGSLTDDQFDRILVICGLSVVREAVRPSEQALAGRGSGKMRNVAKILIVSLLVIGCDVPTERNRSVCSTGDLFAEVVRIDSQRSYQGLGENVPGSPSGIELVIKPPRVIDGDIEVTFWAHNPGDSRRVWISQCEWSTRFGTIVTTQGQASVLGGSSSRVFHRWPRRVDLELRCRSYIQGLKSGEWLHFDWR